MNTYYRANFKKENREVSLLPYELSVATATTECLLDYDMKFKGAFIFFFFFSHVQQNGHCVTISTAREPFICSGQLHLPFCKPKEDVRILEIEKE